MEKLRLQRRVHEVQHAVGNDHVHAVGGDEWMLHAQFVGEFVGLEKCIGAVDGARFQFSVEFFQIEREILDAAFAKLDVGIADALRDDGRVAACDFEHVVGHIHADNAPLRADHLRGDEANFPRAAAEIEHGLAFADIGARVAAAVVALNDFLRNDFEPARIVLHRAAERGFAALRTGGVAVFDGGFDV